MVSIWERLVWHSQCQALAQDDKCYDTATCTDPIHQLHQNEAIQ